MLSPNIARHRAQAAEANAVAKSALPLLPGPAATPGKSVELSLGARLRDWKTLAGFGASTAIVIFFVLTTHLDLAAIWQSIRTADAGYLALALMVYYGAFLFRGLRWRLLLRHAELGPQVRLPSLPGLVEITYLAWFVNSILPAKLGDGYRAYLLKKHYGADLGRTLGTVIGERIADILALVALLTVSGLLVLSSLAGAQGELWVILLVGVTLAAIIGAGALSLRLGAHRIGTLLPHRWRNAFISFVEATLRTFRRDVQLPLYGLTCLIWACEALRLWLVMEALHVTGLAPGALLFTALTGSLLSTIPFTPAGLGAVESASVTILATFGVAASLAGAVAVLDRVINYWSNILVGGILYLVSRKK